MKIKFLQNDEQTKCLIKTQQKYIIVIKIYLDLMVNKVVSQQLSFQILGLLLDTFYLTKSLSIYILEKISKKC